MRTAAVIAAGAAIALAWLAMATVARLLPAEVPEMPALAIDAASLQFFGTVHTPRIAASRLAAGALASSSGREIGRVRTYALALGISLRRTPQEALALALDAMPFGEDCSGIEDASLRYMHQPLRQLDVSQVVALVALAGSFAEYERDATRWKERRDQLLRDLRDNGAITEPDLRAALARPLLPTDWQVRPRRARF